MRPAMPTETAPSPTLAAWVKDEKAVKKFLDNARAFAGNEEHGMQLDFRRLLAIIADRDAQLTEAREALQRKGYRRSCDIPACNCGDSWTHGGRADTRLREISDALGAMIQGRTLLGAVEELMTRKEAAEATLHAVAALAEELRKRRDEIGKYTWEHRTAFAWVESRLRALLERKG